MARGHDYTSDDYRDPGTPAPTPAPSQDRETVEQSGRGAAQGAAPTPTNTTIIASRNSGKWQPEHQAYREIARDRSLLLRDSEIRTLAEIGTFRTITHRDLSRYRYHGDGQQAKAEVRNLTRQGLIKIRTAGTAYIALTRKGEAFLKRHRPRGVSPEQVFYSRFVKPREARHDGALYRLYQEAASRISREGGKVCRVVLAFELKKSVYRKLAKLSELPEPEQAGHKQKIAEEHGLTVVNGKIPLPDLRIEYETADREQTKVDLELATSHYHRDSLAEKSQAGFAIFALQEDAALAASRTLNGDPQAVTDPAFAAGGLSFMWSAMLGDHQLGTTLQLTNRFEEIGGAVAYINRTNRWNWGLVGEQTPYVTGTFAQGVTTVNDQVVFLEETRRITQVNRAVGPPTTPTTTPSRDSRPRPMSAPRACAYVV